jgi:hypothetical protein
VALPTEFRDLRFFNFYTINFQCFPTQVTAKMQGMVALVVSTQVEVPYIKAEVGTVFALVSVDIRFDRLGVDVTFTGYLGPSTTPVATHTFSMAGNEATLTMPTGAFCTGVDKVEITYVVTSNSLLKSTMTLDNVRSHGVTV